MDGTSSGPSGYQEEAECSMRHTGSWPGGQAHSSPHHSTNQLCDCGATGVPVGHMGELD
jgi:hypothetical protein